MGFGIKKTKSGFAPVLTFDVCGDEKGAGELNYDHDWDCNAFRIACKTCCNELDLKAELWMEMNEYLVSLCHNAGVDFVSGNDFIEKI